MGEYKSIIVHGDAIVEGTVSISGSKNSAIPCIAASLLTAGKTKLSNIPSIVDVHTLIDTLNLLGVKTSYLNGVLTIDSNKAIFGDAAAKKVKLAVISGYQPDYWELAEFVVYGIVIE